MTSARQLPLGVTVEGQRLVHQELAALQTHSLTLGRSGSGKSVLAALRFAHVASSLGLSVVVVDPKDDLAPLMTRMLAARSAAGSLKQVAFFRGAPVRLNPLHPQPGLEPGAQARVAARHIESLFGGEPLGQRMRRFFLLGAEALIGLGGSLMDLARMLESDEYARRVSERCVDPRTRQFWRQGHLEESKTARIALLSRLDNLLGLRAVRRSLCAKGCVSGTELLGGVTLINTGGPPAGAESLSRFFAGLLAELVLVPAIFAREVGREAHVAVVIDEVAEVLRAASAEQIERVSSLARALNVSLHLMGQDARQLDRASPMLSAIVRTNARHRFLFEPDPAELLRELGDLTPSLDLVDPREPSKLLSAEASRREWARWVSRLGPRHFVHVARGRAQLLRSPNVPLSEIDRRWAALAPQQRASIERGSLACDAKELDVEARLAFPESSSGRPGQGHKATRGPRLVIPS